jgi:uncharacterized protein (TIGR03435 family)
VTAHLKAGDAAPDFNYTKVLSAPELAPPSLSGKVTVAVFFHDTSDNLESVHRWNGLVDEYAGKSVAFVWVTGEPQSTLGPSLRKHPVKGLALFDPEEATARAYGLELPSSVLIGVDGRILGFHNAMPPLADVVNAALEGRTTTTPPTKATMKGFMESKRVLLNAEPTRFPNMGDGKPNFPPSYALHVTSSEREGRSNAKGPDFWSLQGFSLKEVIAQAYGVNANRVKLPASLDNDNEYDFALVLPEEVSDEELTERFRQGLEDHFHLSATRENRLQDVYLVTAPERKPPAAEAQPDGQIASSRMSQIDFVTADPDGGLRMPKYLNLAALLSIQMEGTVDEFCRLIESELDHPVVNETNLQGDFQFAAESSKGGNNDFLDRLRDQSGLVITPSQRNVQVLVFRPR